MAIPPLGNEKGWGDPTPIVLAILLLIFLGAWIKGASRSPSVQECLDLLNRRPGENVVR